MADIVENLQKDKDTVSPEELGTLFAKKYKLVTEAPTTQKKTYINRLSITKSLNIAVSVDNSIEVHKLHRVDLSKVCRLSGHEKSLTELVFSPKEDYLLYSAGHDGIKLWDTRSKGLCVQKFTDEHDAPSRQYECMDVSCSGRILCAGSQMMLTEAYLIFWDIRMPEPLGGYWNSHTEDITQVKFHKEKAEIMASGSQDGLLNIYNLTESTEDDALTYSLNVENSVEKLNWLNDELISCITQSEDLQIWNTKTGDQFKSYNREKIARSIKRSRGDDCYLVDTYMCPDNKPVLVAGSYGGGGTVLRSVSVTQKKLQPTTNLMENKQIVRCMAYDKPRDLLVTAGESGLINVWSAKVKPDASKQLDKNLHDQRHKPY